MLRPQTLLQVVHIYFMKTRRIILALLIALAMSGALTLWVNGKLSKANTGPSGELKYIATAHAVVAGQILKSEDLAQISWPESHPLTGTFTRQSDLAGRAVLYPLASGEPVQEDQLAAPGSGVGLSAEIPAGMRALSLRSDEIVGVAGFLLPGMRVDVLVTYTAVNLPTPITSIVLQNVEILAVGQKMEPDPKGKPMPVGVVTVLVAPEDAEKAVLASTQGKIQFTLRNGVDTKQLTVRPVEISELSQHAAVNPEPKVKATSKSAPPAPQKYSVEVVAGDKATTETFQ